MSPISQKALAGLIAVYMLFSPFSLGSKTGEITLEKTKTVTVSENGDFKTIEEARDYVRTLDKTKYDGIDIVIEEGTYALTETFVLTKEDSGSEDCPITYKADGDVIITGALVLSPEDFAPATGKAAEWFKEEAKTNIVQIDLKKYGLDPDWMKNLSKQNPLSIETKAPMLYHGDERLVLARYPNEGFITTCEGTEIEGGEFTAIDAVTPTYIYFGDEYIDTVRSWHDITDTYIWGKLSLFWCRDNADVRSVDPEKSMVTVSFSGGHNPQDYGMPFYFYNIPEELDYPGEYYVDEDMILYIYKYDGFDGTELMIPNLDVGIDIDGADYITIDGLQLKSFYQSAVISSGDYFTLKNSKISNVIKVAAKITGNHSTIDRNEFVNLFEEGLWVGGGDEETLEPSYNVVTNNKIHDFAQDEGYSYGLSLAGVGVEANHNEIYDCTHIAVYFSSYICTFEYNYVHDAVLRADDVGALACDGEFGAFGNIVRYNYIKDIGPTEKDFMVGEIDCYFPKCGAAAIYWDCMGSGQTMYGNVIYNVYGNGLMSSGKMHKFENNLVVACAKHAIELNCDFYSSYFYGDNTGRGAKEVPKDLTAGLLERFPELAALEFTAEAAKADNPNFWSAPTGGVVRNNKVYMDKGNFSLAMNKGMKPYSIESYIYDFSTIELDDVSWINSKRGGYDINDLVKENAELLGLTFEQFETIGILPAE